jgi:hypothetical protein
LEGPIIGKRHGCDKKQYQSKAMIHLRSKEA